MNLIKAIKHLNDDVSNGLRRRDEEYKDVDDCYILIESGTGDKHISKRVGLSCHDVHINHGDMLYDGWYEYDVAPVPFIREIITRTFSDIILNTKYMAGFRRCGEKYTSNKEGYSFMDGNLVNHIIGEPDLLGNPYVSDVRIPVTNDTLNCNSWYEHDLGEWGITSTFEQYALLFPLTNFYIGTIIDCNGRSLIVNAIDRPHKTITLGLATE